VAVIGLALVSRLGHRTAASQPPAMIESAAT
jgi:hypothetical protein